MSFAVASQTQTITMTEMILFAEDVEGNDPIDSSLPDGNFKSASKHYTVTPKEQAPYAKEARELVKFYGSKHHSPALEKGGDKLPLAQLTSSYRPTPHGKETLTSAQQPPMTPLTQRESFNRSKSSLQTPQQLSQKADIPTSERPQFSSPQQGAQRGEIDQTGTRTVGSESQKTDEPLKKGAPPLSARQWTREETKEWWEVRYHKREGQRDDQKREGRDQQEQQEEKKFRISKCSARVTKNNLSSQLNREPNFSRLTRPELRPPSVGIFALYYILTKMGIFSDGTSNFAYKKEIELIDSETTETHKKRLDELRQAIKKEQETASWSVANKVFSWLASFLGMIAGIVLIATGVGAVAGAMLIAGALIQISSQIMEMAGGWKKIAEILPGDDTEKKRAVISWMQIGIAVLCLILSGAGIIWGGYAHFGAAMTTASALIGSVASLGYGVSTIGEGISGSLYKDKMSDIKKYEVQIVRLKHIRKDLMEKVELGVDRLEQLFEDLARSLEFEEELFQADQMLNRR